MQRSRLTSERIRNFSCPPGKGQAFLWDTDSPRLAVRTTLSAKSFIFESKLNRQTIRTTIGDVRAWRLDEARAEANRLQTLIDQGIDPRIEKAERLAATKAKQEAARREETPAKAAWDAYLEARASKWGKRNLADHKRFASPGGKPKTRGRKEGEGHTTEPGALHGLLAHPLQEINVQRVSAWMKDEAVKRPTNTALAFRLLRAFLNWCKDHPDYGDQVQSDACTSRSVRDELPKKTAKDDCLQREQLPLWFEYVRKLPNPVHSSYLQALLLTGARREELANLQWVDIDFQWKSLTIPDKVDGTRTIPLTPYVASLLSQLPRANEWVFSSLTAKSGRLQEPRIGHNKALTAAGLPPLSLHGLRRSFGTLAEWVECPAGISAQIMGHKPSAIAEKHYRRRPLDLLRQWHTKIEAWILGEAGMVQPQEIGKPALRVVGNPQ